MANFTTFVFKFCLFFPNKSISFIEDKIWRFYVTSGNLPSCCAIVKGGGGGRSNLNPGGHILIQ